MLSVIVFYIDVYYYQVYVLFTEIERVQNNRIIVFIKTSINVHDDLWCESLEVVTPYFATSYVKLKLKRFGTIKN